jgi:hypothetical protein
MKNKRRDDDSDDVQAWTEHAIYAPPWRMRMPDGRLGPEYGPRSESEMAEEIARYNQTREGGGLWDEETEAQSKGRVTVRQQRRVERSDLSRVMYYIGRNSGSIPARELECAMLYWQDGRSQGRVARLMSVKVETVREWLKRLRERVRAFETGSEDNAQSLSPGGRCTG